MISNDSDMIERLHRHEWEFGDDAPEVVVGCVPSGTYTGPFIMPAYGNEPPAAAFLKAFQLAIGALTSEDRLVLLDSDAEVTVRRINSSIKISQHSADMRDRFSFRLHEDGSIVSRSLILGPQRGNVVKLRYESGSLGPLSS